VLQNHVKLIEDAFNRRLLTCPGFSEIEAVEKYFYALSDVVDKWQQVLESADDEPDQETS
jgi:hypothetical protein